MDQHELLTAPTSRKLRIFSFDPSVSGQFDTAGISEITIKVPWEDGLMPGPVGEYIEVVDADPASGAFYPPVDLNDAWALAQDGIAPSETNPLFHQQMVYAVAMTTIGHFEQALGRVALWSSHRPPGSAEEQFVRRLRIYPHALRDRNAYYSPKKKALLFGYFPVGIRDASNTPGTLVYTCLSHDIIAHETTHALLDGVHPRFNEPVNPDVLAFHEAFADLVALFQHFSYPGVLRDQISRTRGNLAAENLLGQLAQQFGRASGRGTALRDALGERVDGTWKPHEPDVHALERVREPHARGAILVAAVFGAFLKVYRARTLDLYRIASEGTGVLRAGDIPPDLAGRLADEAARTAQYVLQMCIRAVDYCPPVGITFGDYLRAIVTADFDINADDPNGFRLAFVDSFRQWGITPEGMRATSVNSLLWPTLTQAEDEVTGRQGYATTRLDPGDVQSLLDSAPDFSSEYSTELSESPSGRSPTADIRPWDLESDRYRTWKGIEANARVLWKWLIHGNGRKLLPAAGLVVDPTAPPTVIRSRSGNAPAVEVHSVRRALRRSARGATVSDLVVELTQRRHGFLDREVQRKFDSQPSSLPSTEVRSDFTYRAGCTLLFDPVALSVRRVIRTRHTIAETEGLDRMRRFLTRELAPGDAFRSALASVGESEPFALLHRAAED